MFGVRGSYGTRGGYGSQAYAPKVDTKKIEQTFAKFASKPDDAIDMDGTAKLCESLGFEPTDPVALVLCYHCGVKTMGTFTKAEFTAGMESLQCSDLTELANKVDEMRNQMIPGHTNAKKIYSYNKLPNKSVLRINPF